MTTGRAHGKITRVKTNEPGGPAELEVRGWQALSADGAAADFYDRVLDDGVVMLLPGGLVLDDRGVIIESMSGAPWSSHEIDGLAEHRPTPDTSLVTYGVRARRGDTPEYSALIASLYVRRADGWRLAFHQQTPR